MTHVCSKKGFSANRKRIFHPVLLLLLLLGLLLGAGTNMFSKNGFSTNTKLCSTAANPKHQFAAAAAAVAADSDSRVFKEGVLSKQEAYFQPALLL
jgi:hypothetical protein